MEMTSTQRLILANQYRLMGLLDPTNTQKYQRLEAIVKGGFGLELKELDKEFSDLLEAECLTVLNTLRCITQYKFSTIICRISPL